MKKILTPLLCVFAALAMFTSTTLAAGAAAAPEDVSLWDLLRPVYDAFAHGQYAFAGALALVAAVALIRKYLSPRVPFLASAIGGAILTVVGSFAAALAAKLAGGVAITWAIVRQALEVAIWAGGMFSLLKPFADALAAKYAWLRPIVDFVFNPGKEAIAEAEKAGNDAVAAKPPSGTSSVIGAPKDVE